MKSLNDYIWNDEQLDLAMEAKDCRVSSSSLVNDIVCATLPTLVCDTPTLICGVTPPVTPPVEPPVNPPLPLTPCTTIDPLIINGCILPMGVSCGGGGVGVMTSSGCLSSGIGPGDFCNE